MEVINETGLKLLVTPAETEPPEVAALILLKGTFKLMPDMPCEALPEADQQEPRGDELHQDDLGRTPSWVSDFAPFKPHTDCFVLGTAHAPGGVPVPGFRAGFEVGPLKKEVQVWGPRHYLANGAPSAAEPVTQVPLRWELSSGGLNDPNNYYGRGQDPDELGVIAAPQIEDPADPAQKQSAPKPAVNLAPVPAWFPERLLKMGTRDQRWALFRAPLPPKDYDPSIHNAAPFDQQAGNYPRCTELVTLTNLHPTMPVLKTALPGLRPRVVLVRTDGKGEEVTMRLDTVILVPDDDQLVLLWRGNPGVKDTQLSDVELVIAGMEKAGDPPAAAADLIGAAEKKHAASKPVDNSEAEAAAIKEESAAEVQKLLKDVELPPGLRKVVDTEKEPMKLFEALSGYLEGELKRLGHWKG